MFTWIRYYQYVFVGNTYGEVLNVFKKLKKTKSTNLGCWWMSWWRCWPYNEFDLYSTTITNVIFSSKSQCLSKTKCLIENRQFDQMTNTFNETFWHEQFLSNEHTRSIFTKIQHFLLLSTSWSYKNQGTFKTHIFQLWD